MRSGRRVSARGLLDPVTHALAGDEILPGAPYRLRPHTPTIVASGSRRCARAGWGYMGRVPELDIAALLGSTVTARRAGRPLGPRPGRW